MSGCCSYWLRISGAGFDWDGIVSDTIERDPRNEEMGYQMGPSVWMMESEKNDRKWATSTLESYREWVIDSETDIALHFRVIPYRLTEVP